MAAPLECHPSVGSSGKGKGKGKRKEVDEWFSYYGTGLKLHESLSLLVVPLGGPSPTVMRYNIDGSNVPPEPLPLPICVPNSPVEVLGSWNGLVALYHHHSGEAYLFNPNTNRSGCLITALTPMDKSPYQLFGLCYDNDEDEYKGLICDVTSSPDPIVVVLQFKNGNWNMKTQSGLPMLKAEMINTGTVVKGVPYWICKSRMEQLILKFDSKREELQIVPFLPSDYQNVTQLGTLDGQLTATVRGDEDVEIWTLNECAGGNCVGWTPRFVLPNYTSCISTLSWMIKDVEVLILAVGDKLLVYNVMEGRKRLLSSALQGKITLSDGMVVAYIPSLIGPSSSYFEVDGDQRTALLGGQSAQTTEDAHATVLSIANAGSE